MTARGSTGVAGDRMCLSRVCWLHSSPTSLHLTPMPGFGASWNPYVETWSTARQTALTPSSCCLSFHRLLFSISIPRRLRGHLTQVCPVARVAVLWPVYRCVTSCRCFGVLLHRRGPLRCRVPIGAVLEQQHLELATALATASSTLWHGTVNSSARSNLAMIVMTLADTGIDSSCIPRWGERFHGAMLLPHV